MSSLFTLTGQCGLLMSSFVQRTVPFRIPFSTLALVKSLLAWFWLIYCLPLRGLYPISSSVALTVLRIISESVMLILNYTFLYHQYEPKLFFLCLEIEWACIDLLIFYRLFCRLQIHSPYLPYLRM